MLHFQLNLGKPLKTFVVLSYFNHFCLIFSLQMAESLYIFTVVQKHFLLNNVL